jgi:D-alanine-D-alanine ligase
MPITINPQTTSVALLAGGKSGERDISLASGKAVYEALTAAGFSVTHIDPAKKEDLVTLVSGTFDVAFLALHGKMGEDGTIQGMLEILDIPYTGPNVWSSATAIDKSKTKAVYESVGVPTPKSVLLQSENQLSVDEIVDQFGTSCVVKAATEGSALGVYLCNSRDEIESALHNVFEIDTKALVETLVQGDEYTVGVLGTNNPQVLPVIQIIPINEFYDFESKYATGGSKHVCPAPLSQELTEKAQEIALLAHQGLECEGVSRTDLLLDDAGNFWALETNTIPGMTATSLLPDAAQSVGINFTQLCIRLLEDALENAKTPHKNA